MENGDEIAAGFLLKLMGYEVDDYKARWANNDHGHRFLVMPIPSIRAKFHENGAWFPTCCAALEFYKQYDDNLRYG